MSRERRRLLRGLVLLLVRRIKAERDAAVADGLLVDMGYDDCPVCVANRRREAWA